MGYSLSLLVSQFKNLILCEKKHSRITASLTKLGRPDVIDGGFFFSAGKLNRIFYTCNWLWKKPKTG